MTVSVPGATKPTQSSTRDAILARVDALRDRRDAVVESVTQGKLTFAELCSWGRGHGDVGHIKIVTVLQAFPGVGKVRARRALAEIGVAETRPLGGLTDTEIDKLGAAVNV